MKSTGYARRQHADSNGTPFSDIELQKLKEHESACALWNAGEPVSDAFGSRFFIVAYPIMSGEPRRAGWEKLLERTRANNSYRRGHKEPECRYPDFPHTEGDIERVIAWRRANPAG